MTARPAAKSVLRKANSRNCSRFPDASLDRRSSTVDEQHRLCGKMPPLLDRMRHLPRQQGDFIRYRISASALAERGLLFRGQPILLGPAHLFGGGLELAAGGINVAPPRRANRSADAGFKDDIGKPPDPFRRRTFV